MEEEQQELCNRCQNKPVEMQCMNCTSFKNLCSRCDSVIHSLPTKQGHSRTLITQTSNENNFLNENNNNSIDNNKNENYNNEQRSISENNNNLNENNFNSSTTLKTKEFKKCPSAFESNLLLAENYSKDYVKEIKKIYKKEKDELEFKNKKLQNSLDKLKINFTDQINELTNQLENTQKNNKILLDALKKNYEEQISKLTEEHEIEKESLKNDLKFLEEKYNNEINDLHNVINTKNIENEKLNSKISELNKILSQKNEEIFKMKNSFDLMTSQYEKNFNDEKEKIIRDYENKINCICENIECQKDQLLKLVDDREIDMKTFLDEKKTQINNINNENLKLKEELECHKINLFKIRDERNSLENNLNNFKNTQNKILCDNQIQKNEILRLQNENNCLLQENDQLKIQLSKLDKLIYGKIRPTFKNYINQN